MKIMKILSLFALIPVFAWADTVLYYPGDPVDSLGSPVLGAGSMLNAATADPNGTWRCHETITVPSPGWHVTRMFFLGSLRQNVNPVVNVQWRVGITLNANNTVASMGSLAHGFTGAATATLIASNSPSSAFPLYKVEVTGLDIIVAPGTYDVSMLPVAANIGNGMNTVLRSSNPPNQVPGSSLRSLTMLAQLFATVPTDARDLCIGVAGSSLAPNVTGTITLGEWIPDEAGMPVVFEFFQSGNLMGSQNVTLGAGGAFSFAPTLSGSYEIRCKTSHWLRKSLGTFDLANATGLAASLINGDCDDSNAVTTDDYLILSNSFDLSLGDAGYDVRGDLDGNDSVTTDDYLILSNNFDIEGDA